MKKIIGKVEELLANIKLGYLIKFKKHIFSNKPTSLIKTGYEISFYDDFTDDALNKNVGIDRAEFGLRFHPGNIVDKGLPPLDYYSENNNIVSNGTLKQYLKKEDTVIHYIDWDGKDGGYYTIPYTTGHICTKKFKQQYGYFEIRSKMPNSKGTGPAFGLTGTESGPPEIDIYEWYGGKNKKSFDSTFHWGIDKQESRGMSCGSHKLFDLTDDFHVYACEGTPDYIKIFFDGVCIRTFKDKEYLKWFNQPLLMIINNGMDEKTKNNGTFPNIHEVDYVKVYKKQK